MFPFSFPLGWDRRKVAEARVAFYMAAVAALWWIYPEALSGHVYRPWTEVADPRAWAGGMLAICLAHVLGMYANGRAPRLSSAVRALAVTCHMFLALVFAAFFAQAGAYWGSLTYLILVFYPLTGAFDYSCEGIRKAWI